MSDNRMKCSYQQPMNTDGGYGKRKWAVHDHIAKLKAQFRAGQIDRKVRKGRE